MSKRTIDDVNSITAPDEEEEDLYNTNDGHSPATKKAKTDNLVQDETKAEESGSEEEYTDDSDDDVVFTFGNNSTSMSSNKMTSSSTTSEPKSKEGESNVEAGGTKKEDGEVAEEEVSSDEEVSGSKNFLIEDESIPLFITSKTNKPIDINQDVEFDGINMDELDPNFLKEKPWRSSRAKLESYFNYGFNEATWIEYLHRQTRFNSKYNGAKLLYQLMLLQNQGKLEQQQGTPEVIKLKNLIKYQQKQQQKDPPLPTVQPIINAQGTIINPNASNNNNSDMSGGNNNTGAPMFPFPPFNMMQMGNNNRK